MAVRQVAPVHGPHGAAVALALPPQPLVRRTLGRRRRAEHEQPPEALPGELPPGPATAMVPHGRGTISTGNTPAASPPIARAAPRLKSMMRCRVSM